MKKNRSRKSRGTVPLSFLYFGSGAFTCTLPNILLRFENLEETGSGRKVVHFVLFWLRFFGLTIVIIILCWCPPLLFWQHSSGLTILVIILCRCPPFLSRQHCSGLRGAGAHLCLFDHIAPSFSWRLVVSNGAHLCFFRQHSRTASSSC